MPILGWILQIHVDLFAVAVFKILWAKFITDKILLLIWIRITIMFHGQKSFGFDYPQLLTLELQKKVQDENHHNCHPIGGILVFWELWGNHIINCEEIKPRKILGLNVKLKNDESKFSTIMTVKWEENVLKCDKGEVWSSWQVLPQSIKSMQLEFIFRH